MTPGKVYAQSWLWQLGWDVVSWQADFPCSIWTPKETEVLPLWAALSMKFLHLGSQCLQNACPSVDIVCEDLSLRLWMAHQILPKSPLHIFLIM